MPNVAKTHEDCRNTVCVVCIRKADNQLNATLIRLIQQFVIEDYR